MGSPLAVVGKLHKNWCVGTLLVEKTTTGALCVLSVHVRWCLGGSRPSKFESSVLNPR